jgi:peptide/nickel transport system substrate-binding protein
MTVLRRGRFIYRLIRELAQKHTRSLVFGFVLGLLGSIAIIQLAPSVYRLWFASVERIGVVGDYTPTTLPQSIQTLISRGLTTISPDGSAAPGIAKSWETSDSNKTYLFHLGGDFQWHTGKPLTSRDINYNIKDVRFTPIDTATLRVTLQEPFSPFVTLLAKPIFQQGLAGLGSYKVAQIKLKGETLQYLKLIPLQKNSKTKEYRFYKTESQAIVAYQRGDVDMVEDLTAVPEVSTWPNTVFTSRVLYNRVVGLYFNMKDPRLKDRSFRLGLVYAIPAFPEEQAFSPISKTSWAYTDSVKHFAFDDVQAKKLLGNSPEASQSGQLVLSTFSPYVEAAQSIAKSWTEFGIPTVVRVENDLSNGFQVLLSAQSVPPDPDQYPLWHSTQKDTNITGYANVKIDKLLEDGRRELDPEARKKIYADFAKRLVDDLPAAFLYYPKAYSVKRK